MLKLAEADVKHKLVIIHAGAGYGKITMMAQCLAMAFKLCHSAQRRWRKLNRSEILAEVIEGVKFVDGVREDRIAA